MIGVVFGGVGINDGIVDGKLNWISVFCFDGIEIGIEETSGDLVNVEPRGVGI